MKLSDITSQNIRALSFICALLIVPIHASYLGQGVSMTRFERCVMFVISDGVCRVAVPFFFIVSGFLLAVKFRPTKIWYGNILRKRFKSLYVPFLLWNVIYFCFQLANGKGFVDVAERILGYNVFVYPSCMQFWYLQSLFIVILIAPFLLSILRSKCISIMLLLFCLIGVATNNYGINLPQPLFLINFFWMFVGAILAFNWDVVTEKVKIRFSLEFISPELARLSFFVYASHYIGINLVSVALKVVHIPLLCAYFIKIAAGVVMGVGGGFVCRKFLPRVYFLLTGGR